MKTLPTLLIGMEIDFPEAGKRPAVMPHVLRRAGRWGCRLWGGAGLPGLLTALGICLLLLAVALPHVQFARESAVAVKLREDVRVLNAAVRAFELSGGNLEGLEDTDVVLTRLKSSMPKDTARRMLGLRGSMVDGRLMAVMQTPREAKRAASRVLWDGDIRQFVVCDRGQRGVKEFVLLTEPQTNGAAGETDRTRYLDAGEDSGWVWNFNDTRPAVSVKQDPGVGVPGVAVLPTPVDEAVPVGNRTLVTEATAWGYFLSADLQVVGLPLSTGEVGLTTRTASTPFALTHGFNQDISLPGAGLVKVLQVDGTFLSGASSDIGGGPGSRYATGVGEATSFVLKLIQLPRVLVLEPPPVLELRAALLRSSTTISGIYGSLEPAGMGTVANLQVRIMGAGLVDLPVSGEENQVIDLNLLGLAGVRLVVNEAQHSGSPDRERTAERAALHVQVSALNVAGLGLVKGDVYAGRSGAALKAEQVFE